MLSRSTNIEERRSSFGKTKYRLKLKESAKLKQNLEISGALGPSPLETKDKPITRLGKRRLSLNSESKETSNRMRESPEGALARTNEGGRPGNKDTR